MPPKTATVHVLFVCRANQCRSPLAAALLKRRLAELGSVAPGQEVSSAGTDAEESSGATESVRAAAVDLGVDLAGHRSRALDRAVVDQNDLILAMTEAQRAAVSKMNPRALSRTFTVKEFLRLTANTAHPPCPVSDLTTRLHRSRALVAAADAPEDVLDPAGLDEQATAAIAREVDHLVERIATVLVACEPGQESHSSAQER